MKIVCIGDSFIGGFGIGKDACWVAQLNQLVDAEVVNKGVNGDTTPGILARFYRDAVDEKPRYAIIDGGWNDFVACADLGSVQSCIMSIVHQAYANNIVPIMMTVPGGNVSLFKQNWPKFIDIDELQVKYRNYVSWLKDFCDGFSIFYIDCFGLTDNDDFRYNHYLDGIHMDAYGHKMIAEYVAKQLKEKIL